MGSFMSAPVRSGRRSRDKVIEAFEEYFQIDGPWQGAAAPMQYLFREMKAREFSIYDMATAQLSYTIGLLLSPSTAGFWTLFNSLSDPDVSHSIRSIGEQHLTEVGSTSNITTRKLDMPSLTGSPFFSSIVRETMRHVGYGTGLRLVCQDVWIDNRYFLKQGSLVVVPARALHHNEKWFGSGTDKFDGERFMKLGKSMHQSAFQSFGGGNSLCPGRYIAIAEIGVMITMLLLKYDFKPSSKDGQWKLPNADIANMTVAAPPVVEPYMVELSKRNGWENASVCV